MFDLEQTLATWRRTMADGGLTRETLAELEDHLRTAVELAVDARQDASPAWNQALARLGNPVALATELNRKSSMQKLSRFLDLTIAVLALLSALYLEGANVVAFATPPLLWVLGLTFGGLIASHGPRRVWRAMAVAFGGRSPRPGEVDELRAVCRRGHRLACAAGVLQTILGGALVCSVLDQPSLVATCIACSLLGLLCTVLIAELGFRTAERRVANKALALAAVCA